MQTIPHKYQQPEVSTSGQSATADIDHPPIRTLQPATIVGFRSAVAIRCHVGPSLGKLLRYKTAVKTNEYLLLCCDGALLEDTDSRADGTTLGCDGTTLIIGALLGDIEGKEEVGCDD